MKTCLVKVARHKRRIWFHLLEIIRIGKFTDTENRFVVPRGWGVEGNGAWLLNGYRVFFEGNKSVFKLVRVAQHCDCAECHRIVHFKMIKTVNCMLCIFLPQLKTNKQTNTIMMFWWPKPEKTFRAFRPSHVMLYFNTSPWQERLSHS